MDGLQEGKTLPPFANIVHGGGRAWLRDQQSKSMWQFEGEEKAPGTDSSQVQAEVSVARGGSCYFHSKCSASAASSSSPQTSSGAIGVAQAITKVRISIVQLWVNPDASVRWAGQEVFRINFCFNPWNSGWIRGHAVLR